MRVFALILLFFMGIGNLVRLNETFARKSTLSGIHMLATARQASFAARQSGRRNA